MQERESSAPPFTRKEKMLLPMLMPVFWCGALLGMPVDILIGKWRLLRRGMVASGGGIGDSGRLNSKISEAGLNRIREAQQEVWRQHYPRD